MLPRLVCLLTATAFSSLNAPAFQMDRIGESGLIEGRIADSAEKTTLLAIVTWTRVITDAETKLPFTGAVATDNKGAFRITGLASGTYALCIETPGQDFLDPCKWDSTPPTIAVRSGQRVEGVEVLLNLGVRLELEVADQENRVAGIGRAQGVRLSSYIPLPSGRRVDVPMVLTEERRHVFRALVPADRDLPMLVEGAGLQFTDFAGRPWNVNRAAYVLKKPEAGVRQKRAEIAVSAR